MTPSQANASSAGNVHSHSGEDFEMGSPPWPRTPASPVFNSISAAPVTPQEYRTTKVKVASHVFLKDSGQFLIILLTFRNLTA